jgi:type I restriction enzyme R subunit
VSKSATQLFLEQASRDGQLTTAGTAITKLLPPKSMFTPADEHGNQKKKVVELLQNFFERFFSL